MENENKLGVMPITKLIWNMSLPIIASMLVQALYNIVDSWFVSRVSEQALTAVSLAFPAQNLMIGLATGTAVGVNALMGRALGAGLRERADRVANNGVFLAVVGFVISALLGLAAVVLTDRGEVQALISRVPGVQRVTLLGLKEPGISEYAVEPAEGVDIRRELFERLAARNWPLMGLKSMEMTLEDIFTMLTRERMPQGSKKGGKKK